MDDKTEPKDHAGNLDRICEWPGCSNLGVIDRSRGTARQKKLCSMHHYRKYNGVDMYAPAGFVTPREKRSVEDRFWEKVDRRLDDECWPWLASLTNSGYGSMMLDDKPEGAHRISYELLRQEIPEGMVIDHLCGNRWCVNPWHMDVVTQSENIRRSKPDRDINPRSRSPKKECRNGHEFTPENTRIDPDGYQRCKTCERKQSLAGYYRRKARLGDQANLPKGA